METLALWLKVCEAEQRRRPKDVKRSDILNQAKTYFSVDALKVHSTRNVSFYSRVDIFRRRHFKTNYHPCFAL